MEKIVLFVGRKFHSNIPFQNYIKREIDKTFGEVDTFFFFSESDNSIFLHLEKLLTKEAQILIYATKSSTSVIGKLLCTITSDNQILKENMLIPSSTSIFEDDTYLLEYKKSHINVLMASENEELPQILIQNDSRFAHIQLFDMDIETANALLSPLAQTYEVKLHFSNLVQDWILLNIESKKYGHISQFISSATSLLPTKLIPASNMAAYLIEKLSHAGKKVSLAESCTGGLIASYLTKESGSSSIFDGSLVTYSNVLKANWLAVDEATLEKHGAVSEETVSEMSEGVLNVSEADYSIAVSGIAGPEGGSEDKPLGTVFISVRSKDKQNTQCLNFKGDRNYIQEQSALYAIKMLVTLDKELFFK
ncbi:CinA family protein [Sulfurimonas sp. MAG313]|nr:CinA family protein [Sulfurimonas sp. MAG313]MDF1882115.1 CinA family protein [Sulfurimonas sp. MAG313]